MIMLKLEKITELAFCFFILLLPWSTCLIWRDSVLNGFAWEYGKLCLFGSEIFIWFLIVLLAAQLYKKKKSNNFSLKRIKERFWRPQFQIYFLIILLALVSGLSVFWSIDSLLAQVRWVQLLEAICLLVLILNFNFNLEKISLAWIISGTIQSLLAIWQFFGQYAFANKWLGLSEHLSVGGGSIILQTEHGRWLRAYGSFAHPNILGGFLVFGLFFSIYLFLKTESKKIKYFILSVWPIMVTGLFFTFSRSAWLALFISFFVFAAWIFLTKDRAKQKSFIFLILIGLVAVSILFFIFSDLILSRVVVQSDLEAQSLSLRLAFSQQAFSLIKTDWLLGQGLGNYTLGVHHKFNSSWPGYYYQPVHNIFLLVLAELGIFGALIFCLIIFLIFYNSRKNLSLEKIIFLLSLFVICFVGFFDHYFLTVYSGILMFWVILGLNLKSIDN